MKIFRALTVLIFFPYFALRNRRNTSTIITKADIKKFDFKDAA